MYIYQVILLWEKVGIDLHANQFNVGNLENVDDGIPRCLP